MIRGTILTIALVSLFLCHAVQCDDNQFDVIHEVIPIVSEYSRANPFLRPLQSRFSKIFYGGEREWCKVSQDYFFLVRRYHIYLPIRNLGDRLLGSASLSVSYTIPHKAEFTLNYPKQGKGKIISYFEIKVSTVR